MSVHYTAMDRPLSEILTDLPDGVDRLTLCGPYGTTAWLRAYLAEGERGGFEVEARRVKSDGTLHAQATGYGRRVRLTSFAEWAGLTPVAPLMARNLLASLCDLLRGAWGWAGPLPLVTPAALGQQLWRMTGGEEFAPLDAETQALIRHHSGANRQEVLTLLGLTTVPGVAYWDMRFAYGILCEHLPVGPAERLTGEPALGRVLDGLPGRSRVCYRVPRDWTHVGLLMTKHPSGGWWFPSEAGWEGETWADNSLLRQAVANGWQIAGVEGIALSEGLPCDTWARRLVRLYERERDERLRRMVRKVLICTVGSFQGRSLKRDRLIDAGDDLGPVVFEEAAGPGSSAAHPEWCAAVWDRVRYRLNRAMLAFPREELLGCYGDCLWTTRGQGLEDRGKIGDFRLKGLLSGDIRAPHSLSQLHALSKSAESAFRAREG
jgi:hypothetical protein